MADVRHVHRITDGAEDRMIQSGLLIPDREHPGNTLVIASGFMLRKHDVINERIVFAFTRQGRNQNDHLVLPQFVFPSAGSEIRICRRVLHLRMIVFGGDLIRPPQLFRTQGSVLIRRRRQAEDDISRARVIPKAAQQSACRGFLHGVQFPVYSLLNIEFFRQQALQGLGVRHFIGVGNPDSANHQKQYKNHGNQFLHSQILLFNLTKCGLSSYPPQLSSRFFL